MSGTQVRSGRRGSSLARVAGFALLGALVALALSLHWDLTLASDCDDPTDCAAAADTARSPIVPLVGAAAGAVASGVMGSVAGATTSGASGAAGGPSGPAGIPPGWVIDQKVVSGQEAIDQLIDRGAARDGDCVLAPSGLSSMPAGVRGVGWTQTRPHPTDPSKQCLDPDHTAIAVDWPHPPGPTEQTWIEPSGPPNQRVTDIEQGLDDLGFPSPGRVTTAEGETFVRAPENLPDNVGGIAHGTRTVSDPNTGEPVLVIDPDRPVAVDHWPRQPAPSPSPVPVSPTPPPPSPTPPPPPSPTPPPPKQTYIFGMKPLVAIEGGEVVILTLMCVQVRGIHGGSGSGYLIYTGLGGGAGTPVSVWGPGSENQVVATQPMSVDQFAGGGAVGGVGIAVGGGVSANSIVFGCGPLPNVYWVPYGWATGAGFGIGATFGLWEFRRTGDEAFALIYDKISIGAVDRYIGQQNVAKYMGQIRAWILGP